MTFLSFGKLPIDVKDIGIGSYFDTKLLTIASNFMGSRKGLENRVI